MMKWLRSLAAESFRNWHQRRLLNRLRRDNQSSIQALEELRREITMKDQGNFPAPDNKDRREAPVAPKTSGAPKPAPDTSKSKVANRDIEGPRKASTTPRPTGKPLG
jgi:hypothetical protein